MLPKRCGTAWPTGNCQTCGTITYGVVAQNEGNVAADANRFSTALQLWERAIRLTPDRAVLHEQKAQVH